MRKVVVIGGDGIGPEVISSAVEVIRSLGADLELINADMGLSCYQRNGSYLPAATLEALKESNACLFGAITSATNDPHYRSPLLRLRKELDLYANIRPIKRLHPSIGLVDLDLLMVRENTEGMYSGVEREISGGIVTERRVTREACVRIVNKAVELCQSQRRRSIICVHKTNVLRMSDALFREVFYQQVKGSGLEANDLLVDAAAAALVLQPEKLECMVTLNLYGDILSDEASALVGGLGLSPSANLGDRFGLFEPIHGSAPDIAGKGIANPIAAILSAAMMLRYLGMEGHAIKIERAVPEALEQGLRTRDVGGCLGTEEFTRKYIDLLQAF